MISFKEGRENEDENKLKKCKNKNTNDWKERR
jgi:hypothetical protein